MKINKLGQIFDISSWSLPIDWVSHAQSPQAILLDDRIRVFCSGRPEPDNEMNFVSNVFYVDFSLDFQKIIGVSTSKVIELGSMGTFDEHGIFPLSPIKIGNTIYAYTTGWSRRQSVAVETGIGFAISNNGGNSFTKYGDGPILVAAEDEPHLVCDANVSVLGGVWHMWYLYGTGWVKLSDAESAERIYKIGHAISPNGVDWVRDSHAQDQLISNVLGNEECQALPSVTFFQDQYHMVFCYRSALGFREGGMNSYKIGYASSLDLENWTRDDSKLNFDQKLEAWEESMQCYPSFFELGQKRFILYNGNEFGKFGFGLAEVCLESN